VLVCVLAPSSLSAQGPAENPAVDLPRAITLVPDPAPAAPFSGLFDAASLAAAAAETADGPRRACEGCPPRRPVRAIVQTLAVNVLFNLGARLKPENAEYKVTLSSWWDNLKHGFEWDYNSFSVNQVGHPYQGSLYFNTGRANGLSFWESAPLVALGSASWEYFGERNPAAINDFVTTTLGGIALGEMLHRAGWLIRDSGATGRGRLFRELAATVLDPMTGANRFITGDASRVTENPPDLKPAFTVSDFELGVQWNGEVNERAVNATGEPFVGLRLGYNDVYTSPFKQPYDAFALTLRLGGGSAVSEAAIRGRLYGRVLGADKEKSQSQFYVAQAYDYQDNGVFEYGGQSVVVGLSRLLQPSDSTRLAVFGAAGPIVLGAIRSGLVTVEPEEGDPNKRTYDFGPGAEFAAGAALRVRGIPIARASYGGFYIRTVSAVEGVSGKHWAQVLRVDLLVPLWRQFRIGLGGDYINRATYYDNSPDVHQWMPQLRVFLAKVSR